MRTFNIHKPTHKFFEDGNPIAIGLGQLRGSTLYLNRLDGCGRVIDKSRVINLTAEAATNYGEGVKRDDAQAVDAMRFAWAFAFGSDAEKPAFCERHKES